MTLTIRVDGHPKGDDAADRPMVQIQVLGRGISVAVFLSPDEAVTLTDQIKAAIFVAGRPPEPKGRG